MAPTTLSRAMRPLCSSAGFMDSRINAGATTTRTKIGGGPIDRSTW